MAALSWEPLPLAEVAQALTGRWWVAGGWAIELFVGRALRAHDDVDVQVLRDDVRPLAGFEMWTARHGELSPWRPDDRATSIWCRRSSDAPWALELMVADTIGDDWIYRRDPRITRPIRELGLEANGVPYLRPEIQLLYKSKDVRPKDEVDFQAALPLLDDRARAWLRAALPPGHPWATSCASR